MFWNQTILTGQDRRLNVNSFKLLDFPYNCIGKIRFENKQKQAFQEATGFLISSSLILTSAHTFNGLSETYLKKQISQFTFSLYDNVNGNATIHAYPIQNYRIPRKYKQGQQKIIPLQQQFYEQSTEDSKNKIKQKIKGIYESSAKYDFALIKLSQNVEREEYFRLFQNVQELLDVKVCGFKHNDLKYHFNKLSSAKDGLLSYNIDTQGGQSGSPVFKEKGKPILYGIHKGYSPTDKLNMAVMITNEVIGTLQKWVQQMGVTFQVINPIENKSAFKEQSSSKESQLIIKELRNKLNQATTENKGLKYIISQKDSQLAQLKSVIQDLQKKINSKDSLLARIEEESTEKTHQVNQFTNKINNLKKTLNSDKQTISKLNSQLANLKSENYSLKQKVTTQSANQSYSTNAIVKSHRISQNI